jgi:hypothetical protein
MLDPPHLIISINTNANENPLEIRFFTKLVYMFILQSY